MDIIAELAHEFFSQVEGMRGVLNPKTGEVLVDAPESFTGEPGIDWEDGLAEVLMLVPEMTSSEAHQLREDFAKRLRESKERTSLLQSLKRNKPFNHFRLQLESLEMEEDWYNLEEKYAKQRIVEWLKEEGLYSEIVRFNQSRFKERNDSQ
ncbi:UPF0158 family protein [Planococcus sp. 107-1]|uniref:UPF0158 family protein n=1 Tax=Planococcus sp. 107-1 TaxID=2908840 RepID=UPI001F406084|nr:UPF0158 family protein [Planococcus sp. 107-1]UJF27563.1 UPF0158 family protein [Planococcus sp. 107-1]